MKKKSVKQFKKKIQLKKAIISTFNVSTLEQIRGGGDTNPISACTKGSLVVIYAGCTIQTSGH